MIALASTLGVALASAAASTSAPAPDPAVERATEANLEPTEHRRTLSVTLALGGSLSLGFGVADVVGRGGSGSLRLARAMTPRWNLTLEGTTAASLHRIGESQGVLVNQATSLAIGGQFFVAPSFWLRGAVGYGTYIAKAPNDRTLPGPSAIAGGGIELVRLRHVAVGLEVALMEMFDREGLVSATMFSLSLAVY